MRGRRVVTVINPAASGPIHQIRRVATRRKVKSPREDATSPKEITNAKEVKEKEKASETNPRETILVGERLLLETRTKATETRVLVRPAKQANHVCSMRGETVALEKIV